MLDPERSIQIGIRGGAEYLWEFSYDSGMTVLHDEDVTAMGIPAVVAKAREVVGDGPIYVTFDVDGVDPGFAPGTGTPEVGGLTPREVLGILRGLAGLDIVGGDVVEVAPQYDATTNTAQIAAQVSVRTALPGGDPPPATADTGLGAHPAGRPCVINERETHELLHVFATALVASLFAVAGAHVPAEGWSTIKIATEGPTRPGISPTSGKLTASRSTSPTTCASA